MQRTDSLIHQNDTNPQPNGYSHNGSMRATYGSTSKTAQDLYRFPYTPEQRARKLVAKSPSRTQTADDQRLRHIASAKQNATSQLLQRQKTADPNDVKAYTAWIRWIMQADRNLEIMRAKAERGEA